MQLLGAFAVGNLLRALPKIKLREYLITLKTIKGRGFTKLTLKTSFKVSSPEELTLMLFQLSKDREAYVTRLALTYLKHEGTNINPSVWTTIKDIMSQVDLKTNKNIRLKQLKFFNVIPNGIKVDYAIIVYNNLKNSNFFEESHFCLKYLKNNFEKLDQEEFVYEVLIEFLNKEFNKVTLDNMDNYYIENLVYVKIAMISKYLLLCKTKVEQDEKFIKVGEPFFVKMQQISDEDKEDSQHLSVFERFLDNLKYTKVFFNTKYYCLLPTFEKILQQMKKFLPVEQYFHLYTRIHITMVYYKSIRQALKQRPDVFADKIRKQQEGVDIVAYILGKYVSNEIKELVNSYFVSIRELYSEDFKMYFFRYFSRGSPKNRFLIGIGKSMLQTKEVNATLLGWSVLSGQCKDDEKEDILKVLKDSDNKEVRILVNYMI